MALLVLRLPLLAQVDDAGHVHLDHGRDVRGGVERVAHVAGDHLADGVELVQLLVASAGNQRLGGGRGGRGGGSGRRRRGRCRLRRGRGGRRSLTTAGSSGGGAKWGTSCTCGASWPPLSMNACTSFLVTRPPRPVPSIWLTSSRCSASIRATTGEMKVRPDSSSWPFWSPPAAGRRRRCGHRLRRLRRGRRLLGVAAAPSAAGAGDGSAGLAAVAAGDHGDAGVDGTVSPSLARISRTMPVDGRGHLGVDLVGRDLDDRLVGLDAVTDLLRPAGDRALGHAHAHLGHHDIDDGSCGHGGRLLGAQ